MAHWPLKRLVRFVENIARLTGTQKTEAIIHLSAFVSGCQYGVTESRPTRVLLPFQTNHLICIASCKANNFPTRYTAYLYIQFNPFLLQDVSTISIDDDSFVAYFRLVIFLFKYIVIWMDLTFDGSVFFFAAKLNLLNIVSLSYSLPAIQSYYFVLFISSSWTNDEVNPSMP